MNKPSIIFQFKIELLGMERPVWRRIQVPSKYTFWDLHVAIQDSMGWFDGHLHAFSFKIPHSREIIRIGIPIDDSFFESNELTDWEELIVDYFQEPGDKAEYEYDFGDSWIHEILLEGILLKEKKVKYPICIGGERACPPEDCGGVWGYENLLEIMRDPKHEEYEDTMEWVGEFDPEYFDSKDVRFSSPKSRWKQAFS